ncbi:uncharacterized protein LOC129581420 [Paramacrobiotus metropolitanus]|uniref:uncharacterized protein LOC129581420 n=1 Tax=Paramacrobiotus metropolitanus TaxID=2943436 RepID=UPI0024464A85|nr:uncharacterized protein LOC129581420 [Paramacrobiotus metropolitanus]
MVRCAVCDGAKFFEKDGLYYCDTCSTQCADLHITGVDADEAIIGYSRRFQISAAFAPSEEDALETRTVPEGKGLFKEATPECRFVQASTVLRAQVQWLIDNAGVKPELDEIVQHIWISYVEKSLPDMKALCDGVFMDERRFSLLHKSDWQVLFACQADEVNDMLRLHRENFQNKNDTMDVQSATSIKPERKSTHPERLTLPRMLAVLVTGLMHCREDILISDILRWVRLMLLPCAMPSDFIPAEQMHIYLDIARVQGFDVEYAFLEWELGNLNRHLKLVPPRVEIMSVVTRFLEELNLPAALVPLIAQVIECSGCSTYEIPHPVASRDCMRVARNPEAVAMALIVHTLRILFGFDDVWEAILVEADNLARLIDGVAVFSLAEWIDYINLRRIALFKHTSLLQSCDGIAMMEFMREQADWHKGIKKGILENNTQYEKVYGDLSRAFKDSRGVNDLVSRFVTVPVTLRPFRACTQELAVLHPDLACDFSSHSISYLFANDSNWLPRGMPDGEAKEILQSLKNIHLAGVENCRKSITLRSQVMVNESHEKLPLRYLPQPLRWLLTTCAEIIEQNPASLLGQVLLMEESLYGKDS